MQWVRPLFNSERGLGYLHAYDKNAAYLSASNIQLGIGDYQHVEGEECRGVQLMPGRWLADITGLPSELLPHVTDGNGKAKWLDTPTLTLARRSGLDVTVREGYYFPEHARVFEKSYERLRSAREWLLDSPRAFPPNVHSNLTRAIKK